MECWCVSKRLLVLMTMLILMVWQTQGVCIEEERKALLEIKASLIDSYGIDHLPTWVDDGSTVGRSGECCDWELVTCNAITGHVTNLSLYKHVFSIRDSCKRIWPLNVSVFLHFKELTSLDLSGNCLDDGIVNTGLGRLSSLKKLETLDLSWNSITNAALPSLGALTSLRVLSLGSNKLEGYFPALALENLEILDLTNNFGTFGMQDFEKVSLFKKLKILKLTGNNFNKSQFITSLSALPLLKSLRLDLNRIHGSFPAEELAGLTSLEKLDLSWNSLNRTPNIQDCNKLSRLKRFESIDLGANYFNKSIISCLSALPSLKTLLLQRSYITFGSIFPTRELSSLKALETLDLSFNDLELPILNEMPHLPNLKVLLLDANNFNGTLPMEAFTSFHRLEVLDLGYNYFVGSIPSTIQALSSLRAVSFAVNNLNGSLLDHGLCELKNLHELDLSYNMFHGNLPQCFNNLSSLKVLDIASNQFKVDFEKAYDSVKWDFLLDSLRRMGFRRKWVSWIATCLQSSTISILVNATPTKEFGMGRGLRQGDPMAPFLFLAVVENLNLMMEEAKDKGLFEGIKVGQQEVKISHLQFADDAIFFGKWSIANLKNLFKILECFHLASRLKINMNKSKLFGLGVPESVIQDWALGADCEGGNLPFS